MLQRPQPPSAAGGGMRSSTAVGGELTDVQLRQLAQRQESNIASQQQTLVMKEQRLKHLKQQLLSADRGWMSAESEKVSNLRQRVTQQESRLNKLRQIRQQVDSYKLNNNKLSAELDSVKALFADKERDLASAVSRVEKLTAQLETLASSPHARSGAEASPNIDKLKVELREYMHKNERQRSALETRKEILTHRRHESLQLDRRIQQLQSRLGASQITRGNDPQEDVPDSSNTQYSSSRQQQGISSNGSTPASSSSLSTGLTTAYATPVSSNDAVPPTRMGPQYSTSVTSPDTGLLTSPLAISSPSQVSTSSTGSTSTGSVTTAATSNMNNLFNQVVPPNSTVSNTVAVASWKQSSVARAHFKPVTLPSVAPRSAIVKQQTPHGTLVPNGYVAVSSSQTRPRLPAAPPVVSPVSASQLLRHGSLPTYRYVPRTHTFLRKLNKPDTDSRDISTLYKDPHPKVLHLEPSEESESDSPPQSGENGVGDKENSTIPRGKAASPKTVVIQDSFFDTKSRSILKTVKGSVSGMRVRFSPLALLLDAALEGEYDLVRSISARVDDLSAANDEGITALHNAVCAGHMNVVRFLVEQGADVNAADSDGWTPLHCAASCNNIAALKLLAAAGAAPYSGTFSDGETAIDKVEEQEEGAVECVRFLTAESDQLTSVDHLFAVFSYTAESEDELSFEINDKLLILRRGDDVEKEWWWARLTTTSSEGYVPRTFLSSTQRKLTPSEVTSRH